MALNTLEMVILNSERNQERTVVKKERWRQCISKKSLLYDKKGEEHYNIISALHKSMRNSDVDAAILAGQNAGSRGGSFVCSQKAHPFCQRGCGHGRQPRPRDRGGGLSGLPFYRYAGMQRPSYPRGYLSFVGAKSNALYTAYEAAKKDAVSMLAEPVPLHIRNGVTGLMRELHYGEGYEYRSRQRREGYGYGMPAGFPQGAQVLYACRPWFGSPRIGTHAANRSSEAENSGRRSRELSGRREKGIVFS